MSKIDGGLRSEFRKHLPLFDWLSVETGLTALGVPDSNYCTLPRAELMRDGFAKGHALEADRQGITRRGVEGWIEHKQTKGHAVTLEPEQVGWILRRVRNGGRVWIAVRQRADAGPRREARDVLWLIPGRDAKVAKVEGLVDRQGWLWTPGGPARWDWRAVAQVLTS